ncbi:Reticulon [Handroanthus impetiginosus]|uniref:Reticulon-like protein n=1 Tax=Handroanthus impetiginosus TaxID=429701 RepID=A0A2G9GRN2_9LAMI|nr:Reticulon [Handroanthus impetiginosus]
MSGAEFSESSEERVHDEDADQENFHLFGHQKPVQTTIGGGKPTDIILWRNRQISAAILACSTIMWLLFQRFSYHFITFICHSLILSFSTLFLWSNLSFFVYGSPLKLPEITVPEDLCKNVALLISNKCNKAGGIFRETILGLWVVSIVGSWLDFLTLVYIIFVMLLTMPPWHEKHEEKVDTCAHKAKAKLKRQYGALDEKVLRKLPKVSFNIDDKHH